MASGWGMMLESATVHPKALEILFKPFGNLCVILGKAHFCLRSLLRLICQVTVSNQSIYKMPNDSFKNYPGIHLQNSSIHHNSWIIQQYSTYESFSACHPLLVALGSPTWPPWIIPCSLAIFTSLSCHSASSNTAASCQRNSININSWLLHVHLTGSFWRSRFIKNVWN